jgi:hypothetical protein
VSKFLSREKWQDQFYSDAKAKEADITDDTLSKRFRRAIGELVKSQQIGTLGQWSGWTAGQPWTCPDIEASRPDHPTRTDRTSVYTCPFVRWFEF